MKEFFVVTHSNAAPMFSDMNTSFVTASSAQEAAEKARKEYKHPAGLYCLVVYESSDAYQKRQEPVAQWLSKRADIRTNGVPCSHCGGATQQIQGNGGPKGTTDTFSCVSCHKETRVDMSTV